jgi:YYY domain-containing protein
MEYGLVLVWLAMYAWLAIAGLPVAALLCSRFEDRGAALALPLTLAVLWLVAYWVGHAARVLDALSFGYPALAAGLLVVLALDAVALRRGVDIDWRGYLRVMGVFTAAFLLLVVLRAVDPGAWPGGGEKFLDFGLLASALRATALPPEDVWFAGESVSYYYGGHMLASLLARLADTPAVYAYNLALAGFYATFVSAAYGLAGAIGAARGRSYHAVGLTAAGLVGVASNLSPLARLLAWLLPEPGGARFADLLGVEMEGLALGLSEFNYWFASRVVPGTINEFPFFAWLNGDLHAHMMAPPFLLLAAGLLFAYYRTPAADVGRRRLLLALLAPLSGVVAVVSTWSFPTVGGLTLLALALAPTDPADLLPGRLSGLGGAGTDGDLRGELRRTGVALAVAAAVLAAGALSVLPFFLGTASGRGVGLLPERSPLGPLLLVHGAFLLVTVLYLRDRLPVRLSGRRRTRLFAAWLLALLATWLYQATALVVFLPVVLVGWWLCRRTDRVGYETVLLVAAAGLVVIVEFAYVSEEAGPGRMNTVFKTYAQVWAIWATAAAVVFPGVEGAPRALATLRADLRARLAGLWHRARPGADRADAAVANGGADSGRSVGRADLRTLLAVGLLVSLSMYAALGIAWQVEAGREDATLDARAYLQDYHPGEVRAIEWLADRPGQPTLASAPGVSIYQWVNGPSSLTGLPTVAGWAHEIGYRGEEAYFDRVEDVDRLFEGSPEQRARLIEQYDVAFVYVGPVERERYGELSFRGESWVAELRPIDAVDLYVVRE